MSILFWMWLIAFNHLTTLFFPHNEIFIRIPFSRKMKSCDLIIYKIIKILLLKTGLIFFMQNVMTVYSLLHKLTVYVFCMRSDCWLSKLFKINSVSHNPSYSLRVYLNGVYSMVLRMIYRLNLTRLMSLIIWSNHSAGCRKPLPPQDLDVRAVNGRCWMCAMKSVLVKKTMLCSLFLLFLFTTRTSSYPHGVSSEHDVCFKYCIELCSAVLRRKTSALVICPDASSGTGDVFT